MHNEIRAPFVLIRAPFGVHSRCQFFSVKTYKFIKLLSPVLHNPPGMRQWNNLLEELVFVVELCKNFVISSFPKTETNIETENKTLLLPDAFDNKRLTVLQQLLIIVIVQVDPVFRKAAAGRPMKNRR